MQRVVPEAVLGEVVLTQVWVSARSRRIDDRAKKLPCFGALVRLEQRVAFGLVDEYRETAVPREPGQHAHAAQQIGQLTGIMDRPCKRWETVAL